MADRKPVRVPITDARLDELRAVEAERDAYLRAAFDLQDERNLLRRQLADFLRWATHPDTPHPEHERNLLRNQLADVEHWAMVNEIAAVPLDWAGLGRILHP